MSTARQRRPVPALALAVCIAAILAACGSRVPAGHRSPEPATPGTTGMERRTDAAWLGRARPAPRRPVARLAPVRGVDADPRWALVVGVNEYPGEVNDLETAVADARTMLRALRGLGFRDDHVRVLLDGDATAGAILKGVRWLAERTRGGGTGVLLFAGHALQVPDGADGDDESLDEAFVGTDFGFVLDGAVADALRPSRGALWLAFATCNAAGFADAAAPGRVLTFASGENELAYESKELGASFFVHVVVRRAMIGAGVSTAEGAVRWARGWMTGEWKQYRPLMRDLHPGPLPLASRPVQAGA